MKQGMWLNHLFNSSVSKLCLAVLLIILYVMPSALAHERFTRANVISAMDAYANESYEQSFQEFYELALLGSDIASAQLGMMVLNAQGAEYNPAQAWAYFSLAAEFGDQQSGEVAEEVFHQLTPSQQLQGARYLQQLHDALLITQHNRWGYTIHPRKNERPSAEVQRRPRYPLQMRTQLQHAIVVIQMLVNREGTIAAHEVLFSTDERAAASVLRFLPEWRYEAAEYPHTRMLYVGFSMQSRTPRDRIRPYIEAIASHTWQPASAGNQAARLNQAFLFGFLTEDLESSQVHHQLKKGEAPEIKDFIDIYNKGDEAQLPVDWSPAYWLHQAAQIGEPSAQKILAIYHDEWREYLIERRSQSTIAWALADWLSYDDDTLIARGRTLLPLLQNVEQDQLRALVDVITPFYSEPMGESSSKL